MKIGIFLGEIPSATFIEQLIRILAGEGNDLILFGKIKKKVSYPPNVIVKGSPSKILPAIPFIVKESLKCLLTKPRLFVKIAGQITKSSSNIFEFIYRFSSVLPVINSKIDILHIQWAVTLSKLPELFAIPKYKIILSLRGAHINYTPLAEPRIADIYKNLFPKIHGFHAVSLAIANEAAKYGADLCKTKVIHTAISDIFLNNQRSISSNSVVKILSVGRLHWKKGYHYALEAMRILKVSGFQFHYTIIASGSKDSVEELLYHLTDSGLEGVVSFIHGASHEEVLEAMQESSLFLLPSVEEGIANVALEAMASGLPVISTDCGGMTEAIKHGETGFIVPVRSPAAIADQIKYFATLDQSEVEDLTQKAYVVVQNEFSARQLAEGFSKLYKSVLES